MQVKIVQTPEFGMSESAVPSSSLSKHFDFKTAEPRLYQMWEEAKIFSPEFTADSTAPVFTICLPPPNANGELHLGHSYGYTVMDILGRFRRMRGERVLLLPGKDHAGIQTQVVFEKRLQQEKIDPKSISTDELFQRCYDFCIDRSHYMRSQEKRLGLGADWSREMFTLDPRLTEIVFETFERMWRDGLVYRGRRIINWSVYSQTGISDVEVEYKEVEGGLWYLCYPLVTPRPSGRELTLPSGQKVSIGERGLFAATTRPETMLGDTALAVHPDDPRYRDFIGAEVIVPLVERRIKVVGDARVDPAYGTGVVKVTPAHDFTDYEIGLTHNLPAIQVIGKDGLMTAEAGTRFAGMKIAACRDAVLAALGEGGLLVDTAKMMHKVPVAERGKDIIEPLISEQWFVNVDKEGNSLKRRALELLRSGRIQIHPPRFQVLFEQWLENLRDWNISRQIWWGHRMPVWYRGEGSSTEIYVGRAAPSGEGWRQETDTFDTWFSSGQWAFSTLAAQQLLDLDNPKDNEYFPNHTMVMGRDILFFWACRMMLLTTYRMGDIPWKNIFFTGLIRDEHGQKMSKSKGNGIDPVAMIDRFGADALRLSVVVGATAGNDLNLGERKIEGYSKFINKIWNAAKLIEMKVGTPDPREPATIECETVGWMLRGLGEVHRSVTDHLTAYEISLAADELYAFTWQVFCDWYLEMMKVLVDRGSPAVQEEVRWATVESFRTVLTMLHPLLPFVTEEIYQKLPFLRRENVLAVADWNRCPRGGGSESEIPLVIEIVSAIRSVKAALAIPHKVIRIELREHLRDESRLLVRELARVEMVAPGDIADECALRKPYSQGVITLDVEEKELYRARLQKDLASNRAVATSLEAKLSGAFASQAKPEIVQKERDRLATALHMITEIEKELSYL